MPMNISRRVLLKAGAVYAAVAAFPVAASARLLDRVAATNIAQLSLPTFQPLRDEIFQVTHEGGTAALRLLQITDLSGGIDKEMQGECFSLLFRSAPHPTLGQGMYKFFHPKLGSFAMFIVPVNQPLADGSGHFEAIFNRTAP